jgi:hypothetical protein
MTDRRVANQQSSLTYNPSPPTAGAEAMDIRLDSWKEIAAYLGRSARCAQRWEKSLGLPVHRIKHAKGCTVYAYVTELDGWRRSRERAVSLGSTAMRSRAVEPSHAASVPHLSPQWRHSLCSACRQFLRLIPLRTGRS